MAQSRHNLLHCTITEGYRNLCSVPETVVDLRDKMHRFMYIGEPRENETTFRIAAGETGYFAGAEGATAPETLRQKNRAMLDRRLWKEALAASADGITFSGNKDRGGT